MAVIAGVWAMVEAAQAMARFGIHAALIAAETVLVTPALLLVALRGGATTAALGLKPLSGRHLLLAFLGGATLWAASLGLMNLQFVVWPPPAAFLEQFRQLHQALRPRTVPEGLLSVLAIAIMPALCEETLFRGIVLPALSRWSTASGVIGSAILFALIHIDAVGTTPVFFRLPFALCVGVGLGLLRVLTGSLLAAIAAHAMLNTITFATVFLSGAASQAIDEPQAGSGSLLLLGGAAATAWIFRALRR